jgi:hypothetical protein
VLENPASARAGDPTPDAFALLKAWKKAGVRLSRDHDGSPLTRASGLLKVVLGVETIVTKVVLGAETIVTKDRKSVWDVMDACDPGTEILLKGSRQPGSRWDSSS